MTNKTKLKRNNVELYNKICTDIVIIRINALLKNYEIGQISSPKGAF